MTRDEAERIGNNWIASRNSTPCRVSREHTKEIRYGCAAGSADPSPNSHARATRGARILPLPTHERENRGLQRQGKARDSASLRI
jgi:hypothetical protein